jgi:hypothetical protein
MSMGTTAYAGNTAYAAGNTNQFYLGVQHACRKTAQVICAISDKVRKFAEGVFIVIIAFTAGFVFGFGALAKDIPWWHHITEENLEVMLFIGIVTGTIAAGIVAFGLISETIKVS